MAENSEGLDYYKTLTEKYLLEVMKEFEGTYLFSKNRYLKYKKDNAPIQIVEDLLSTWDKDNWKLAESILDNYENNNST